MRLALAALVSIFTAQAASAAAVYSFQEVGNDVVGTLSGSLDLTGLSPVLTDKFGIGIEAANGTLFSGPDADFPSAQQFDNVAPIGWSFGPGTLELATATSGDLFAINNLFGQRRLILDSSYMSGSPLAGSLTFGNQSFSSLGIAIGSYSFALPSQDTITVSFEITPVPLPAGSMLLIGGVAAFAAMKRKKRSAAQ